MKKLLFSLLFINLIILPSCSFNTESFYPYLNLKEITNQEAEEYEEMFLDSIASCSSVHFDRKTTSLINKDGELIGVENKSRDVVNFFTNGSVENSIDLRNVGNEIVKYRHEIVSSFSEGIFAIRDFNVNDSFYFYDIANYGEYLNLYTYKNLIYQSFFDKAISSIKEDIKIMDSISTDYSIIGKSGESYLCSYIQEEQVKTHVTRIGKECIEKSCFYTLLTCSLGNKEIRIERIEMKAVKMSNFYDPIGENDENDYIFYDSLKPFITVEGLMGFDYRETKENEGLNDLISIMPVAYANGIILEKTELFEVIRDDNNSVIELKELKHSCEMSNLANYTFDLSFKHDAKAKEYAVGLKANVFYKVMDENKSGYHQYNGIAWNAIKEERLLEFDGNRYYLFDDVSDINFVYNGTTTFAPYLRVLGE